MQALIVYGGWDGHEPRQVSELFEKVLKEEGFAVERSDTLDALKDETRLLGLDLIVPVWTMGKISGEQANPVFKAVRAGVGIAGCHGGMCDSFRENTEWQFMTGGQWVSHPGGDGVEYTIHIKDADHELTRGISDFKVKSEQYYMHIDPAIRVWATCTYPTPGVDGPHNANGFIEMPQVWTKRYGKGRVYYNALGHVKKVFDESPSALELMRRGFKWAAAGKQAQ